jgi:uncharacterized membrane protein YczE
VVIATSFVVLLLWLPLRQLPGLGTLLNAVLIGLVADATLAQLSAPDAWVARGALLVGGILLNAVAGAMYIGSQFGPGPRDGLMTGLVRRTGRSVRLVRTVLELTVLGTGWLLGGTAGVGTVLYALGIGPLVHTLLPRLTVALPEGPEHPPGPPEGPQRLVAMSTDASGATMISTVVNRSSVSQFSRSTSTRPS